MKKHQTNKFGPPFGCEFCGIEYDKLDELNEHRTYHVNHPNYQCLECKIYMGKTTKLLKQHMRSHVSNKQIEYSESVNNT